MPTMQAWSGELRAVARVGGLPPACPDAGPLRGVQGVIGFAGAVAETGPGCLQAAVLPAARAVL